MGVRAYSHNDLAAIVRLSLLAWEPVFRSFRKVLGPNIYPLVYPGWRKSQKERVETTCQAKDVLVAEFESKVVGFLAYEVRGATGGVLLLAVHPEYQNRGFGTALNMVALEKMKAAGAKVAEVGTGGDEGHAPARRSYEKAGFTPFPLVRYFKTL